MTVPRDNTRTAAMHEEFFVRAMHARVEGSALSANEQSEVESHFAACDACASRYRQLEGSLRQLKQVNAVAGQMLVRETQTRVRARARRLEHNRERALPLRIAAAAALGWSVVSTPLLWGAMHSLSHYFNAPTYVWEGGFFFGWLAPTALIGVAAISRKGLAAHQGS